MFKLEKEIYLIEDLPFDFQDLPDNEKIIKLIAGKMGLMDILDDSCKLNPSDSKFYNNIQKQF